LPLAYMFIRMQPDLSQAEVTGFALPDTITVINDNSGYYPVNENMLVPYEEIEYLFKDADDLYNVDDNEIYTALDGDISLTFVKKLLLSFDGRRRFKKAYTAQRTFSGINITPPEKESEEQQEILSENNDNYGFTTVVSPNLSEENINDTEENPKDEYEILEQELDISEENPEIRESTEAVEEEEQVEEINTLFEESQEEEQEVPTESSGYVPQKKKSMMPLLLLLLLLAVGGYFGYTKFAQTQEIPQNDIPEEISIEQTNKPEQTADAMPVETVEKKPESMSKNEGNSVSIPAIERNLDASILVSNLRIDWDVPSGYVSNTQARRYFEKLGKIIRLNLKAELLLLSKPPISNKISVELKYNPSDKCFEAVGITASSGEKVVDDVIFKTVQRALSTKLNISTESFGKLSGNPVLIIRL
ncbi:hypothetical protein IKQ21_08905, partial [bacterium]|nr:hypothetical protein [bacterium]